MKKNNKGFSLVELIVVILIMAILGVALTPQVMKWVNNSRISADNSNYDALFDAAQIAVVKKDALDSLTTGKKYTIKMATGGTTLENSGATPVDVTNSDTDKFTAALKEVMPNFASITKKVSAGDAYEIEIDENGVVTRKSTIGTVDE